MGWAQRCVFGGLPQASPKRSRPRGPPCPAWLALGLWEAPGDARLTQAGQSTLSAVGPTGTELFFGGHFICTLQ